MENVTESSAGAGAPTLARAREEISRMDAMAALQRVDQAMARSAQKEQKLRDKWRKRQREFVTWESTIREALESEMETQRKLAVDKERLLLGKPSGSAAETKTKLPVISIDVLLKELSPSIQKILDRCDAKKSRTDTSTPGSGVPHGAPLDVPHSAPGTPGALERAETEEEPAQSHRATTTSATTTITVATTIPINPPEPIVYKKAVPFPEWKGKYHMSRATFMYTPTDGLSFTHVFQLDTGKTDPGLSFHCVRLDLRAPLKHLTYLFNQLGVPSYHTKKKQNVFYANISGDWMEAMTKEVAEEKGAYHEVAVALYPSQRPARAGRPKQCALCTMSMQGEKYIGAGYKDVSDHTAMCQRHEYCVACTGFMAHLAHEDYGSFPCIGLGADPAKNLVKPCV
jgi:hypothetical protein